MFIDKFISNLKTTSEKRDFEIRGKILSSSLLVEEQLNRIIYNFFIPKSSDKITRSKFLELFVFNKTFGGKKRIYSELLKTARYKAKVEEQLNKKTISVQNGIIKDFESFKKLVSKNLTELIEIRNDIAHGYDISKAFVSLEENEFVFSNKNKFKKINNSEAESYIKLTNETIKLLDTAQGILQD